MAQRLTERVIHWKKKLERGVEDEEALSIIRKLYSVPITVKLLQDTGIGKLIKQLGKQDGELGAKAAMVLKKWKEVVSASQSMPDEAPKCSSKQGKSPSDYALSAQTLTKQKYTNGQNVSLTTLSEHKNVKKVKYSHDSSSSNHHKKHNAYLSNGASPQSDKASSKYNRIEDSLYGMASTEPYNPERPEIRLNYNSVSGVEYKPTPISSINGVKEHKKAKSSSEKCDKYHQAETQIDKHRKHGEKRKKMESSSHVSKAKHADAPKQEIVKLNGEQRSKQPSNGVLKSGSSGNHVSSKEIRKSSGEQHKSSKSHEANHKAASVKKMKVSNTEEFTASEVSFEACLGFNDIVTSKKKKAGVNKPLKVKGSPVHNNLPVEKPKTSKVEGHKKKSHSSVEAIPSGSSSGGSNHSKDHMPPELKELPKSIDLKPIDITSTLPEIQPNYKPLPQIDYDRQLQKKKNLSNEEAIMFTSSKKDRTAVYSGRRNFYVTEVPTLFELCTRVLIENIDSLDYFGGVPYFIIKPILERCTPQRLYQLEHYNAYLLEDTNELWQSHCNRDFRTHKLEEGETWRELYLRVFDEKEKKLKLLTANISASMSKSHPVRQVKLAYVDSVVKPPRDVARKQAKHGTALAVNHTMKSGSPSKVVPKPAAAPAAMVTKPIATVSAAAKKPKVAPLMAKTLKTLKHVYRR